MGCFPSKGKPDAHSESSAHAAGPSAMTYDTTVDATQMFYVDQRTISTGLNRGSRGLVRGIDTADNVGDAEIVHANTAPPVSKSPHNTYTISAGKVADISSHPQGDQHYHTRGSNFSGSSHQAAHSAYSVMTIEVLSTYLIKLNRYREKLMLYLQHASSESERQHAEFVPFGEIDIRTVFNHVSVYCQFADTNFGWMVASRQDKLRQERSSRLLEFVSTFSHSVMIMNVVIDVYIELLAQTEHSISSAIEARVPATRRPASVPTADNLFTSLQSTSTQRPFYIGTDSSSSPSPSSSSSIKRRQTQKSRSLQRQNWQLQEQKEQQRRKRSIPDLKSTSAKRKSSSSPSLFRRSSTQTPRLQEKNSNTSTLSPIPSLRRPQSHSSPVVSNAAASSDKSMPVTRPSITRGLTLLHRLAIIDFHLVQFHWICTRLESAREGLAVGGRGSGGDGHHGAEEIGVDSGRKFDTGVAAGATGAAEGGIESNQISILFEETIRVKRRTAAMREDAARLLDLVRGLAAGS